MQGERVIIRNIFVFIPLYLHFHLHFYDIYYYSIIRDSINIFFLSKNKLCIYCVYNNTLLQFMDKRIFVAFLHKIWFSHKDLHDCIIDLDQAESLFHDINETSLQKLGFWDEKRKKILDNLNNLQQEKIKNTLEKFEISLHLFSDETYPESLKHIAHPPFILYMRGNIVQKNMFAVVWSRKMSSYGKKSIEKILPDILPFFTIVSWWALWCDTQAHKTAIEHGGETIVVCGTWIDISYPAAHARFFQSILDSKRWALLSSFPLGEWAFPYNFPIRNEIVVGLSKGILLVEAQEKSWTLITAQLALDFWKDLFAFPGDIWNSQSRGCNLFIQSGAAKMTLSAEDILCEYNHIVKTKKNESLLPEMDPLEAKIYVLLSENSFDIDEIIENLSETPPLVMMKISLLELKKCIKKDIFGKYSLL